MNDAMNPQDPAYQEAYRRARRQVKKMRGWYIHALVFVCIVGFAWLRYLFGDALSSWTGIHRVARMPLGMTLGWGLALTIHGLVVFGRAAGIGPFGREWENKQVQRLLDAESKTNGPGKW
jgi:predicted anti-sigma-YlaC factor YlaD